MTKVAAKTKPGPKPAMTTETLVRAIIARQPRGVRKKRLVKLAYLAELRYASRYGRRLSDADFFRHIYGPYSRRVIAEATRLSDSVVDREDGRVSGYEGESTSFSPARGCEPVMPPALRAFFDEFMSIYGRIETEEITKEAYRTAPFRAAQHEEEIDFAAWSKVVQSFSASPAVSSAITLSLKGKALYTSDNFDTLTEYLKALV